MVEGKRQREGRLGSNGYGVRGRPPNATHLVFWRGAHNGAVWRLTDDNLGGGVTVEASRDGATGCSDKGTARVEVVCHRSLCEVHVKYM